MPRLCVRRTLTMAAVTAETRQTMYEVAHLLAYHEWCVKNRRGTKWHSNHCFMVLVYRRLLKC